MPEGERSGFVSRKEFYASMGALWLFLMLLALDFFNTFKPSEATLRGVGLLILMGASAGMALLYTILAARERSRRAETPGGETEAKP